MDAQLEPSFPQRPVTFLAGLLAPVLMVFHLVGPVPSDLGLNNGALRNCPTTAHCASQTWESNNPMAELSKLSELVRESPRTVVVDQTETYLHAEASSAFLALWMTSNCSLIATTARSRHGPSRASATRILV